MIDHTGGKRCRHFTGVQNKTCKAGLSYDQFPPGSGLPCIDDEKHDLCSKFEAKTAEEIAARREYVAKRMEAIGIARQAIVEACGGPWKRGTPGSSGVIDCPVCDGKQCLRYSRAGYNGHIHARCGTKDCVSWME